jgi:indolepyruvate ferredoxin oxidoreductase beta subunit
MKQRVVVSGTGGQGILFLTRLLAECAVADGLPVITSETHGMAQRGGAVLSTVCVGGYASPLVRPGSADLGIFLSGLTFPIHGYFLRPGGVALVNAPSRVIGAEQLDATGIAHRLGRPVAANLVLLGYVVGRGLLFAGEATVHHALRAISPSRLLEGSLEAFSAGIAAARAGGS